jgi:2-methylcitrate dehydratase PrpD
VQHSAPRTGLEAKFSLRHVVAMALAGLDTANLANYSDESTNEPVLTGLRDRVQVELVRACGALTQAEVVIETADGPDPAPSATTAASRPPTWARSSARLEAKFRSYRAAAARPGVERRGAGLDRSPRGLA